MAAMASHSFASMAPLTAGIACWCGSLSMQGMYEQCDKHNRPELPVVYDVAKS